MAAQNTNIYKEKAQLQDDNHIVKPWHFGGVFWGMLFMVLGGLALAGNLDFVKVNWLAMFKLWPILVIACGLSLVRLKNIFWRIFSLFLVVAMMLIVIWVGVGEYPKATLEMQAYRENIGVLPGEVKKAEISIDAGAVDMNIGSSEQTYLVSANLYSNVANLEKKSSLVNDTQRINLGMRINSPNNWWIGDVRSEFDIMLNRNYPIRLNVHSGASNIDIDASKLKITNLNVKTGASSLELKLGDSESLASVNIDSGVSSVSIKVPSSSGVQVKLESGLSSKELFDLEEVSKNTFQTSNYDISNNKITIIAKVGVSSFTIDQY